MPPPQKKKRSNPPGINALIGKCSDETFSDFMRALGHEKHRSRCADDLRDDTMHLMHRLDLPAVGGGQISWEFLEPNRLIAHVIEACPQLAEAYARAANECAPTVDRPWKLRLCYDEYVPGDKLKAYSTRKAMVLGFNFVDLGEDILSKDYSWFIPIVTRQQYMKQVLGGWSHMLAKFLHVQLLGTHGLQTTGAVVMLNGSPLQIFANVESILGDYDGIRIGWDWKGSGSLRPNIRYSNVFKKNSDLAARIGDCVEITCTDQGALIQRSAQDFEDDVDLVLEAGTEFAAGRLTRARFEEIEQAAGQNWNPLGFASDPVLRRHCRPLDVLCGDWVHGVLNDGILCSEMRCFVNADEATLQDYEAFMKSDLRFPNHFMTKGKQLYRVFDSWRNTDEEFTKVKANASELLGLYSLMRHFIEKRFVDRPGYLAAERASFAACCKVVDTILLMKRGVINPKSASGRDSLSAAMFDHLRLHIAAYGDEFIKPKHSLNTNLPEQFFRIGVVDAFTIERLHLRIKPIAERAKNLPAFHSTVLGRVLHVQCKALASTELVSGLRGKIAPLSEEGVHVSRSLECASLKVSVDDVVCNDQMVGVVKACVSEGDGQLFVVIDHLQCLGRVTLHSHRFTSTGQLLAWRAESLFFPHSWYIDGADVVVIW